VRPADVIDGKSHEVERVETRGRRLGGKYA
jgi:hypothetical protein